MKIAYLTNSFPSEIESYVTDEVARLRAEGVQVLTSSARRVRKPVPGLEEWQKGTLYLQAPRLRAALRALVWCCAGYSRLSPFLIRIAGGGESLLMRIKALVHTWLGVYYAVLLEDEQIDHIHVHHGFFSSWIAMVAARVLGISYSLTLHGSDLLVRHAYLDIKLEQCSQCFTVSEFNRRVIVQSYPSVPPNKVLLRRLGVDVPANSVREAREHDHRFVLLAPGRLHPVKNHAFLVSACAVLKARGFEFACLLAGDGPERQNIERQIRRFGLQQEIKLLGHVAHEDLLAIYPLADLVVLTSKSEGIPVVLMEAMARGCVVLAPRINGIPELVIHGKTGYLYAAGSLTDFTSRVEFLYGSINAMGSLRNAARNHVKNDFNRATNLEAFAETLASSLYARTAHEDSVLQ